MKVAFISHYSSLYGANKSLLNLIDGLQQYDIESYVIVPSKGSLVTELQLRNIQFSIQPISPWVNKSKIEGNALNRVLCYSQRYYDAIKRLSRNIRVLSALSKQLSIWNIDLVYTNTAVTPIGALLALKLKLPHIWHLREFVDLDYDFNYDWGKSTFNYFLNKADVQIAISTAICAYFKNSISSENMEVIYNGVAHIKEFDYLYSLADSKTSISKPFTFSIVGKIHPNKGQSIAIQAFSSLVNDFPNICLLVVGGGDDRYLRSLAHELNVSDKVEFWGYVENPYSAYLSSDVVLMCSKNEGMGRVTVEAMSICRPVIGYNNAGTAEVIQHEHTGLLYDNEEELKIYMRKLLENPNWAKELGKNAWHVAREKYSVEKYARCVYEVLSSVTKSVEN